MRSTLILGFGLSGLGLFGLGLTTLALSACYKAADLEEAPAEPIVTDGENQGYAGPGTTASAQIAELEEGDDDHSAAPSNEPRREEAKKSVSQPTGALGRAGGTTSGAPMRDEGRLSRSNAYAPPPMVAELADAPAPEPVPVHGYETDKKEAHGMVRDQLSEGSQVVTRERNLESDNRAEPEDVVVTSLRQRYTDHGLNPFTIVADDAQSTFSIDVDTASYTQARRDLAEQNTLPPQAGVRVEEFVNYFDYGYVKPTNDPFAVNMEAMPDPFRPGHHILRVGVQGKEIGRDERQPVHLTFLVDVSGSMSSADKLGLAKKSLHMMVDGLREDDTVALATYAGATRRVLEPTSAANKQAIHQAIEDLQAGGSTAMSSGIDIAYSMAKKSFKSGHENRVVVLSDGDANVGATSWEDMLAQIKTHADKGVTLSTIGFGRGNYQDTLMEQLANKGDGNNFYIDDQAQAQRVFVEELSGTMTTIARDVKIQVEFNDESVAAYRLIGYENRDIADRDFRNDRVDAGEVGSGHNVTALYEVVLADGYERELATVRLRWEQPGPDGVATEKAWTFQDSRLKETPWLASRDVRIAYSAATFAEVLRGSPNAAEIDLGALATFTEKSVRSGKNGQDDKELVELIRKAEALGAGGGALMSAR